MKLLIDIGHPKHFHAAKFLIKALHNKGHNLLIIARDKDCTLSLLNLAGISYFSRGKGSSSLIGRFFYLISSVFLFYRQARKFKPDNIFSFGSPYAAFLSFIIRKQHIVFDDTDHNLLVQFLYKPFTKTILVPSCFQSKISYKHIKINTYLELAYLHPYIFKPTNEIYNFIKIPQDSTYIVVRFVSWKATHDIGKKGFSDNFKIQLIKKLSALAPVFISSETQLPTSIQQYSLTIPPHQMHNLLANASLVYGESATVAAESAMLGVPSIYVSPSKRGYIDELVNKYSLVLCYKNDNINIKESLLKSAEIINNSNIKTEWQQKRQKLLSEKIDITAFLVWFIENYPESRKIMKENPDYQYNFK